MGLLVSCRVFNLLPGLQTGCLILLSADSRVVSSGGPAGATSHLRQSRVIHPSPVLNPGLFDDDWATFGVKLRFFFIIYLFFNVLASSTTSFISFIAFCSFFLQQFVRLIEILFEFLLEPKEVSLHARARAYTHARTRNFNVNGTLDEPLSG